jgi:hypothetical protein
MENTKNVIFWVGVKSDDPKVIQKHKYGDYQWMEYSKLTWQYWAEKNNCHFVEYNKTANSDLLNYKVNWQRWFDVFDYIESKGITDYDQILLTDASIMVKWDMPNIFEDTEHKFCALRGNENLKWTYQSVNGYADLFPGINFRYNDYFASGYCIFNKNHKKILGKFKEFYYINYDSIVEKEDISIKRGRDQPVLNYFLRMHDVDIKILPIVYGVNHLYRRQVLTNNWQLNDDMTPHFIKYFYTWIFSGWPDRGETRNNLMKQTWELIKNNYL